MEIFFKNKKYQFSEISEICNRNDLVIVDCLKDENMISVEACNNGELGDCIFEFKRIERNLFKLTWVDKINLKLYKS